MAATREVSGRGNAENSSRTRAANTNSAARLTQKAPPAWSFDRRALSFIAFIDVGIC